MNKIEEIKQEFEEKFRHAVNTDATEHCPETCDVNHAHFDSTKIDTVWQWIESHLKSSKAEAVRGFAKKLDEFYNTEPSISYTAESYLSDKKEAGKNWIKDGKSTESSDMFLEKLKSEELVKHRERISKLAKAEKTTLQFAKEEK